MLPAHLAARLLKQRREAEAAEFARQLPLHTDYPGWPSEQDEASRDEAHRDEDVGFARREPDWTTNY